MGVKLKLKDLKEKPASKEPQKGVFVDLFARAKGELALPADLKQTQSKPQVDSIRVQPTISKTPTEPDVSTAPAPKAASKAPKKKKPKTGLDVTSPSQLKRIKSTVPRSTTPDPQADRTNNLFIRLLLICFLFGGIWFGTQVRNERSGAPLQQLSPQQMRASEERVEQHREEIGHRLNRERIGVQYQNSVSAPPIGDAPKVPAPDMMAGAPLKEEPHHRTTSRDRAVPVSPDYSDARIQYTLQEQQAANDYEARAQKQYIDEFIANADKAGVKVKVGKDGLVLVTGQTDPIGRVDKATGEIVPVSRDPSSTGSIR